MSHHLKPSARWLHKGPRNARVRTAAEYLIQALEPRTLLSAVMLKDVNTGNANADITGGVAIGGAFYFAADDGVHGREVWRSDGTAAGTALLKDANPGPMGSNPLHLTDVDGTLYFITQLPVPTLYKSDGTAAGTVQVATVPYAAFTSGNFGVAGINGKCYFTAPAHAGAAAALWVSDGTAAGTVELTSDTTGSPGSSIQALAPFDNAMYFTANDGQGNLSLWRTDGSAAGTAQVQDYPGVNYYNTSNELTVAGNDLFFSYSTYPNYAANYWVAAYNGEFTNAVGNLPYISRLIAAGSDAYIITQSSLYAADGSSVSQVPMGSDSVQSSTVTAVGSAVYFASASGALWKITPPSLAPAKVATQVSNVAQTAAFQGKLYYFMDNYSAPSAQLWSTDGTAPQELASFNTDNVGGFVPGSAVMLFAGGNQNTPGQPWVTDGTVNGTHAVLTISMYGGDSQPDDFTHSGALTYFTAIDGLHGRQLWKTDGTAAGTAMVDQINPAGDALSYYEQSQLTDVNGTLFFIANDGVNGQQIWKSNGTQAGTSMVTTPAITQNLTPGNLFAFNGKLYFTIGTQLWVTDGTSAGTKQWTTSPGFNAGLIAVNNTLLSDSGGSLYAIDLLDPTKFTLGPGASSNSYTNRVVAGNYLYYLVNYQPAGQAAQVQLYRSDGTSAGTTLILTFASGIQFPDQGVSYMTNLGGIVYFVLQNGTNDELWKTDGTSTGTQVVKELPLNTPYSGPAGLTALNGALLFAYDDGVHGRELWRSDGTASGTVILADITQGAGSSFYLGYIAPFATLDGKAYFASPDGVHGIQVWQTDGTTAGTTISVDLNPGDTVDGANPLHLSVIGQQLYFDATDGVHGREPWVLDPTTASIRGVVFNDANNSGSRDLGEQGIGGVTVYLDLNQDGSPDSGDVLTTTDVYGSYSFGELPAGSYVVREMQPVADAITAPLGLAGNLTLSGGQNAIGPDFGNVLISSVTMNLAYFMALARNFGKPGTFASGDANGDGTVNLADLLLITRHFGKTLVVNPLIVTSTADDGSLGTLRYAIAHSNAGDTITFDPTVFAPGTSHTITLNGSELELTHNLTIQGPGSANLSISGNNASRIFQIDPSVTASISGLTLTAANAGTAYGGAINNSGTLNLTNCSITSSTAKDGGGLYSISGAANVTNCAFSNDTASAYGGALFNDAQATSTVTGCTFTNNSAGHGGALLDYGTALILINDTITQNSSTGSGGGINNVAGNLIVSNCTIVNNTTGSAGGGIFNGQTATINNSIVAQNSTTSAAPSDLAGNSFSGSNNLIGDGSGGLSASNHNLLGTTSSLLNPKLGSLSSNGGPTLTFMPLSGSPVIDAGSNALISSGISTDQRGYGRIFNGTVDIGAVEFGAALAPTLTSATQQQPASATRRRRV